MRIEIDYEICQHHQQCSGHFPELFEVDDQARSVVRQSVVPEALLSAARKAVSYCPEGAISTVDT